MCERRSTPTARSTSCTSSPTSDSRRTSELSRAPTPAPSETYCKIRKAPLPVKPLSGRPLFATAADAELYVSLPDVERRLERAVERGLNALILGDRGSGKTTLVRQLLFRRREAEQSPPAV
jgi:type IV secretory pathway ATPase VirB11/archaellum biosynthesis ATPase